MAVELPFLLVKEQAWLVECLESGQTVNATKAAVLRKHSKDGDLSLEAIADILTRQAAVTGAESKPRKVNVSGEVYARYFKSEQSAEEVKGIIEAALVQYFSSGEEVE